MPELYLSRFVPCFFCFVYTKVNRDGHSFYKLAVPEAKV